jgi:hypothetical protein
MKIYNLIHLTITRPLSMGYIAAFIVVVLSVVFFPGAAYADDPGAGKAMNDRRPAFFTTLNDVPLMAGLTELPDETLIFDKPEGRIVETAAVTDRTGPSAADIEAFYAQTLPHLGWRQVAKGQYLRQNEVLRLDVETGDGSRHVMVTVMPRR